MAKPKFSFSIQESGFRKNLNVWEEFVYNSGYGGVIRLDKEASFSANATVYDFYGSTLKFWGSGPYQVDRDRTACWRYPSQNLQLFYVKQGSGFVKQGGRELHLRSGDCFLLDSSEPTFYGLTSAVDFTSVTLKLKELAEWLPHPKDVTAISWSKHSSWGLALTSVMSAMTPEILDHAFVHKGFVIDQLQGLLALAANRSCALRTHEMSILRRLQEGIHDHFHEPDFCPETLIHEQKIPRHILFSTFAKAGTSFGKELYNLRMEKARQFLEDRRYHKKSIAEIGALVGYQYPGHFITSFRRVYGLTPSLFRRIRQK